MQGPTLSSAAENPAGRDHAAVPGESVPAALDPEDIAEREVRARRARLRLALALAILASTLVLSAIGGGTYTSVERSVRNLREASLRSTLDVQTKTLEVWIADQKLAIERLTRDRRVREHVATLAAIAAGHGKTPELYCAAPARRPLVAELDDAFSGTGAVGFNIVDRSGRIIASSFREYCGLGIQLEQHGRELATVFRGKTVFLHPTRDASRLSTTPARLPLPDPTVWIETAVPGPDGAAIAALAVGHHANAHFATILAAGRSGETGEAYAIDRHGTMLSESRFGTDLIARGTLLPGGHAALSLQVRPPGAEAPARTKLVEAALAGIGSGKADGVMMDAYPGYYGRDVVGAWRWLPQEDMVVVVEISAAEAFAPLQVLRTAFITVFGALVLAVIAALAAWFSAAQQRTRNMQRRLGPYLLGNLIGEGGIANVYEASHELLKRPTAIKLLKPSRATDEMTARFEREAKLASQLSHPNMVEIYDYGRGPGGVLYYAMEYLKGATVGEIVRRSGALPVPRAVHLLRQICAGLAEAHGRGLVHRDVSASNIMVCHHGGEYDFVKILDFGLVKSISRAEQSQTITRTMRLLGTPLYMAPERLRDPADVDARADIYAVGAVAFLMLTGRKLFNVDDELALTSAVLNETPPRASAVATQPVPRELGDLIEACLCKRREDRPQHITDLSRALEKIARDAPWTQQDAERAWKVADEAPAVAA